MSEAPQQAPSPPIWLRASIDDADAVDNQRPQPVMQQQQQIQPKDDGKKE